MIVSARLRAIFFPRFASYKTPREVRFVTDWPMSATKIQKFRLRAMLEEDLAPR